MNVHTSRITELKRELALARASSDYWRAKYIAAKGNSLTVTFSSGRGMIPVRMTDTNGNALYWYERAARSPMDDCDE